MACAATELSLNFTGTQRKVQLTGEVGVGGFTEEVAFQEALPSRGNKFCQMEIKKRHSRHRRKNAKTCRLGNIME